MEHIEHDGVRIPRIGYGTWEVTGQDAVDGVTAALDRGYRHIDTAQAYGNEEEVGQALAASGVPRDEVFLTTKVWKSNAKAQDVRSSTEASLRQLQLDHVDLLLIHWPTDAAPIEETLVAMDQLRKDGLTRLIGVSNYTTSQLRTAADVAPVATNQVEYHPLLGQDAVLGTLRELGGFLTAYSPLAHGEVLGDDVLAEIGQAHGKTGAQVALRWLIQQPDVVALPRSSNPDHIADNIDVFDFMLDDEQMARIDALPKDQRQIDPSWAPAWDS